MKKPHLFKYLCTAFFCLVFTIAHAQQTISFRQNKEGHIIIKAKVNGTEGDFIFDTGAGLNLITKKFAVKAGKLAKHDGAYTSFRATGEPLTIDIYSAVSLTVGTYTDPRPMVTVIDADLGPYDGLISLMSFKKQPITIDYIGQKIVFETSRSVNSILKQGIVIPLQLADNRDLSMDIFANFIVNDKLDLQFLIDCGAGNDVYRLNGRFIPILNIDTASAKKSTHKSEFNAKAVTTIYQANVNKIAVKNLPQIFRANVNASFIEGLIYDGVVSLNWIGKKITIDLEHRRMIVQQH